MDRPRKKRKRQGNYRKLATQQKYCGWAATNLGQLTPIQNMPGIILEDETVVDSCLGPNHAVQTEEQKVPNNEEKACINLLQVSPATETPGMACTCEDRPEVNSWSGFEW